MQSKRQVSWLYSRSFLSCSLHLLSTASILKPCTNNSAAQPKNQRHINHDLSPTLLHSTEPKGRSVSP